MLSLISILLVVFIALGLMLAAATLFIQGYLYNEPAAAIYWRAPAAAAVLTLFVIVWTVVDSRSIHDLNDAEGRYQPLFNFSLPYETVTYEHLWITTQSRPNEHFVRRGNEYVGPQGRRLPTRPLQIVASHKADGEKHVFKPQRDAKGTFKVGKDESLRYYEDGDVKKRSMVEGYPGQISIFHFSWLLMSLFLHFGFLLAWFVSLWLLLRFQWPHALGLALCFWFVSLVILPAILAPAEKARKEHLPAQPAALKGTNSMSRLRLSVRTR